MKIQDVIRLSDQLFRQIDDFGVGVGAVRREAEKAVHITPEAPSLSRLDSRSVQAGDDDQVSLVQFDVDVPLHRQATSRLVTMDPRNHEQRGPRLFSPDVVDGQFLPGFMEVRLGLRFREPLAIFGCQITKPEAE